MCLASRRMSRERTSVKLYSPKQPTSMYSFHSKYHMVQFALQGFYFEGVVSLDPVCLLLTSLLLPRRVVTAYVRSSEYAVMHCSGE